MNLHYITDNKGNKTDVVIPINDWEQLKARFEELENIEDDYTEPTKEEILNGLKEALEEVKLHQEGKLQLKPARDLLNEI
jgi:hypothetical protein